MSLIDYIDKLYNLKVVKEDKGVLPIFLIEKTKQTIKSSVEELKMRIVSKSYDEPLTHDVVISQIDLDEIIKEVLGDFNR